MNDENMSLVQWFVFSFAVSFQYKYIFSVENIGNLLVSLNTRKNKGMANALNRGGASIFDYYPGIEHIPR